MAHAVVIVLIALACCVEAEVLGSGGCDNAVFVPGPYDGQTITADTTNAPTFDNVCNLDSASGTYFFTISPDAFAPMVITTCEEGTAFDTVLAVYQGDDCDSLECVLTNDDMSCSKVGNASTLELYPSGGTSAPFAALLQRRLVPWLTVGLQYWVMVSGYRESEGQFQISFTQAVSVNTAECSGAVPIPGPYTDSVTVRGSTSGNTTNTGQPCNLDSEGVGNWYIIFPTPGALVTVATCGGTFDFDTQLAVLAGDCDDLKCMAFNDNNCSSFWQLSKVKFTAEGSASFYVYVTGFSDDHGIYDLIISERVSQADKVPFR